jgi:hypothetical protein
MTFLIFLRYSNLLADQRQNRAGPILFPFRFMLRIRSHKSQPAHGHPCFPAQEPPHCPHRRSLHLHCSAQIIPSHFGRFATPPLNLKTLNPPLVPHALAHRDRPLRESSRRTGEAHGGGGASVAGGRGGHLGGHVAGGGAAAAAGVEAFYDDEDGSGEVRLHALWRCPLHARQPAGLRGPPRQGRQHPPRHRGSPPRVRARENEECQVRIAPR